MMLERWSYPCCPENPPAAPNMTQSVAQNGNPPVPESSPSLSSRLEALDEEFLAAIEKTSNRPHTPFTGSAARAQPEPRRPGAGSGTIPSPIPVPEQTAAHNLFTAKQPPAAAQKKTFALVLGGVTALATVAIGVYFWWQLQPRQISPGLAVNPVAVSPPPTILPAALPVAPMQPIATPTDTAEAGPLARVLIAQGVISEDQLRIALLEQMKSNQPVGKLLVSRSVSSPKPHCVMRSVNPWANCRSTCRASRWIAIGIAAGTA
jgi:hypothetical protein